MLGAVDMNDGTVHDFSGRLERPMHTAAARIQCVHRAVLGSEEQSAPSNDGLRGHTECVGEGKGPFELEMLEISGREAGLCLRNQAGILSIDAPSGAHRLLVIIKPV